MPNDDLNLILGEEPVTDFTPEVRRFDQDGDPIKEEPKQETKEEPKSEQADGDTEVRDPQGSDLGDPDWKAEAQQWQQLAKEQQEAMDEMRSALPLLQKIKDNPNSADLIQAFLDGELDESALKGKMSKNVDEIDEWLNEDGNIDEGEDPRDSRKGDPKEEKPIDENSPEYKGVVERLNTVALRKRNEGYSDADVHRFLNWLPNGKPEIEDLWYAFMAQCRREGRPIQPVRNKAKDLAVEGVGATGGSDRPTEEAPQTLEQFRSMGFHQISGDANEI